MANEPKVPAIPLIYKALQTFQGLIQVVHFDTENPFFKSKYASFAGIVKAITPHMQVANLCFTQVMSGNDLITRVICAEDGSEVASVLNLPITATANAQGVGSALTYMKRYALCAILGIVGDADDDGNAATKEQSKDTELETLRAKVAAYEARDAKAKLDKAVTALWAKFTANPTEENKVAIAKEVAKLAPEKEAAFTTNADAHIAKLAANVPNS